MSTLTKIAAVSTALLTGCTGGTSIPKDALIGGANAIPSTVDLPSLKRLNSNQSWECDGGPERIEATPAIEGKQLVRLKNTTVFVADGSFMKYVTSATAADADEQKDLIGGGFGEFNAAAEAAGFRSITSFGEGGFGFVLGRKEGSETLRLGIDDVRFENEEPGENDNTLAVTFNNGTTVVVKTANLTYDNNNTGWVDLDASDTGGLFTAFKINSPTGASFIPKSIEWGGCEIETEERDSPSVSTPNDPPANEQRRSGQGRANNVDGHASLNQPYTTNGIAGYGAYKFG